MEESKICVKIFAYIRPPEYKHLECASKTLLTVKFCLEMSTEAEADAEAHNLARPQTVHHFVLNQVTWDSGDSPFPTRA